MFNLAAFKTYWVKSVNVQLPAARSEVFKAKLAKMGVNAPYGTPAAKDQLAKAVAKANVSGTFMGDPIKNGVNGKVITAQVMVDGNYSHDQAQVIANKMYGFSQ